MKWLTLEDIKQQIRMEENFNLEDGLLEAYGESAEESVLNILQRTETDLYEEFGKIPVPVRHATLLLVDHFYQHRSPTENISISIVPYSIDFLLKPYMRLTEYGQNQTNNTNGCKNL